ncbi:MAG: hypothetical protein DI586_02860 [Micavibrio aeruginosavorus]|uniref:Acyltransferase n=1 Tax=Micavibrio aeruginosavorus TaxID=349221 RepID=A0A2W5FS90_9BACT|nr:MAG: hypothetical protein DI586_02860 [Micavibrio aeruginosavorus]
MDKSTPLLLYGSPLSNALIYRPDIDGLRAIAVLSVVLFHLGGTPLTGGFVGVDIFFVISGYLITTIILKGLQQDNFSLGHFYERRILRIFPALFTVLLATSIASAILLFPSDFKYFGETLSAAGAFGSNFIFWKESGYFEAGSLTVPLLHTWSLAVEEQFYIFFPLVIIALYKFRPGFVKPAIVLALIASFALALAAVYTNSMAALFYLLPTRAWELLVGAVLATSIIPSARAILVANLCGVAGLALIAYAALGYNEDTIFPGPAALAPTIGAALIIYSGMSGDSWSRRILGTKVPVFFGKISYSLYLWHWPLIVFFTYAAPVELSGLWRAGILIFCIGISVLSWRYIEQPARNSALWSRRKLFLVSFMISLCFIGTGALIAKKEGFPDRFSDEVKRMNSVTVGESFPIIEDSPNKDYSGSYNYKIGDPKARPSFLVWGDSHAQAAAPGIDLAARKLGKSGYVLGVHSCIPSYLDVEIAIDDCNEVNKGVGEFLRKHDEIKTVILIGRWSNHHKFYAKKYKLGKTRSPTLLRDTLDNLFTELEKQGRQVVFMTEMPHASVEHVPLYLTRATYYGSDRDFTYDLKPHKELQERITPIVDYLSSRHKFRIVDPVPVFCPQGRCPMEKDGQALYSDSNHITTQGSKFYRDMYLPLLEP